MSQDAYDEALFRQIISRMTNGTDLITNAQIAEAFWRVAWDLRLAIEQQKPDQLGEADALFRRRFLPQFREQLRAEGWQLEETAPDRVARHMAEGAEVVLTPEDRIKIASWLPPEVESWLVGLTDDDLRLLCTSIPVLVEGRDTVLIERPDQTTFEVPRFVNDAIQAASDAVFGEV